MIGVRAPFEDEGVHQPAVEAHPDAHPWLGVVGLLGRDEVVELAVQVRHRQHRQHSRDRLVLGGRRAGRHSRGVADATVSCRSPKKNPAVIRQQRCGVGPPDRHRQRLGVASPPSTNLPMPIIAVGHREAHRAQSASTASAARPAARRTPWRRAPRCSTRHRHRHARPASGRGQNQHQQRHATTSTTAAAAPAARCAAAPPTGPARRGNCAARSGTRPAPSTNDGSHHGIAQQVVPRGRDDRAPRPASAAPGRWGGAAAATAQQHGGGGLHGGLHGRTAR